MAKKLEIERKYLLKKLPGGRFKKTLNIIQLYTKDARLRQITDLQTCKKKWVLTKKKKIGAGIYEEDERNISYETYLKMSEEAETFIMKTRYIFKYDGSRLKWEIDLYKSINMVTAEIELPKVDTKFKIPPAIQKEIIMDVTEFPQFTNKALSEKI